MNEDKTVELVGWGRASVVTRYLGPTDTRGSRIAVWRGDSVRKDDGNAMVLGYDDALNSFENHSAAINAYIVAHCQAGHSWHGKWAIGSLIDGYVATWVGDSE